jgi:hypothetical protein
MRMIVGGGRRSRWRFLDRVVRKVGALLRRVFEAAPEGPETPPPLAKAEALRQGALLAEFTDARSNRRVA